MMAMEMTLSPLASWMPRTPMESRPLNRRTSSTRKRMAWPSAVVISTSLLIVQVSTPTISSPSSSFMAILPFWRTSTKSASELRRTVPRVVANMMSRLPQELSSSGSGMMEVTRSPCSSGRMLISALPLALAADSGRRHTLSL